MSDKWRVQCFFKPYGVSDDIFQDIERLKVFVAERLERASRIQIDRQKKQERP